MISDRRNLIQQNFVFLEMSYRKFLSTFYMIPTLEVHEINKRKEKTGTLFVIKN